MIKKLKKVLVVYKKSAFDVYARERNDRQFLKLLKRNDDITHRFVHSDQKHNESFSTVKKVLKSKGIKADFSYRSDRFNERGYDLILTVGGDGTFLDASHHVFKTPILGLNSSPSD